MKDRTKKILSDFEKAFENLKIGTETAKDDLGTDGTLKRFELCYELAWKLIKTYLEDLGIICKNPRICFKEAFLNGLIDDDNIWFEMIEDRNLLVHTYEMERSREIFENIKKKYTKSFNYLLSKIRNEEELITIF